jgi:hypothetical protein
VALRLVSLVDVDLSPKAGARDKERLARELERLPAISNEGRLKSSEAPGEVAELEAASLGRNAERNFD